MFAAVLNGFIDQASTHGNYHHLTFLNFYFDESASIGNIQLWRHWAFDSWYDDSTRSALAAFVCVTLWSVSHQINLRSRSAVKLVGKLTR